MRTRGTLLCLGSGAAFGAMGVFGKLAFDQGANAATVLSVRFTLAAAMFWALVIASGGLHELRSLPRRDIAVALALGGVGYALQAAFYFTALEHIDVSLLALLLYTFPAMVAVASVLLGRERVEARRVVALGLASSGLVLVVGGAGGSLDPLGVALALAAAVTYTTYILSSEGVAARVDPRLLSAIICSGAAVTLALGSGAIGQLRPGELTLAGWGWLGAIAAVSTVGAVTMFFAGLRRAGATSASILATVEPLVTVTLAFLVFGEHLALSQIAGGALVLSAVLALNARLPLRAPIAEPERAPA